MTIEELKVGSRVMFGNYGVNSDRTYPIWWVKATKDCDFITESVLDYLMFDAKEPNNGDYGCRNYGNPNYNLSNIRQFLNSEDEDWFIPQHAADNWPNSRRQDSLASYGDPGGTYRDHHGFLRHFEDLFRTSINSAMIDLSCSKRKASARMPHLIWFGECRTATSMNTHSLIFGHKIGAVSVLLSVTERVMRRQDLRQPLAD